MLPMSRLQTCHQLRQLHASPSSHDLWKTLFSIFVYYSIADRTLICHKILHIAQQQSLAQVHRY